MLVMMALGVAGLCAGSAHAAVEVIWTGAPSTDLADHTTWTMNVSTSVGLISSMDGYFKGPMNQVNPFGTSPTVFQDNNHLFGFDPSAGPVDNDSQFMFHVQNEGILVVTGETAEGPNVLSTAMTKFAPFASRDAVQLCIANGDLVEYNGAVVADGQLVDYRGAIPEPATLSVLAVAGLALLRKRK